MKNTMYTAKKANAAVVTKTLKVSGLPKQTTIHIGGQKIRNRGFITKQYDWGTLVIYDKGNISKYSIDKASRIRNQFMQDVRRTLETAGYTVQDCNGIGELMVTGRKVGA